MDAPANTLRADLLGEVRFTWGGTQVAPRSRKANALLLALALRGTPMDRGELAELLWAPGRVQSVRQALHELRSLPGAAQWLEAGAEVALRVDADVARFEGAVAARAYADALGLWRAGSGAIAWRDDLWREAERAAPSAFADWLEVERERVRAWHQVCLHGRAAELERMGEVVEASRLIEALLDSDPLNETAYRSAMRLAVARGDPHAALAVFERCRRVLERELGVAPLDETLALAREVEATLPQVLRVPRRRMPLPAHATPFVGRERELSELRRLLRHDATRLVTLVGPGGVGKSSVALEAALRGAPGFPDGATFVPLAGVERPEDVPSSLAQALDLPLADGADVEDVVVAALREARALLLVDNLEHVLTGAGVLGAIAASCPDVRILATSREALDVPGETVVPVAGLSLPPLKTATGDDTASGDDQDADAVRLFAHAARRVHAGFELDAAGLPAVERLVRRLEGLPLAIVLAATWVRHRPVPELADAVVSALADLEANPPDDVATRHRSLRATFAHSWQLLGDDERHLLTRVAVCRGGFERDAAAAIANASLRGLLALVNKSLLTRDPLGRFGMLETIRASALAAGKGGDVPASEAHAEHYLRWLASCEAALTGPRSRDAQQRVSLEIDNVRAAFAWATAHAHAPLIDEALAAHAAFVHLRGLFAEGARVYGDAIAALDTNRAGSERTVARLRVRRSACLARTSDFDEALDEALRGFDVLRADHDPAERGLAGSELAFALYLRDRIDESYARYAEAAAAYAEARDDRGRSACLHGIAMLHFGTGRDAEAEDMYGEALAAAREADDPGLVARALGGVGMCLATRGAYGEAAPCLEEAVRLARVIDDRRALAASLNNLARLLEITGRRDASIAALRECIALRREIGDRFGLGLALSNLGVAQRESEPESAEATLQQALAVFREIGNRSGTILTLNRLASVRFERGDDAAAYAYHDEALALAVDKGEWPQALEALVGLGALAGRRGRPDDALTVLQWALVHPQQEHAGATAARALIDQLAMGAATEIAAAAARAAALTDDDVVALARRAASTDGV